MTALDTHPDPIPLPGTEPESEETGRSKLRPLDRRILQLLALVCVVPAILVLHWVDETNNMQKNLKPPEKVTTVPPGEIGELIGARWKVFGREKGRPRTSGSQQGGPNDVTELRLAVAVRPGDAASAKLVGSYGLVYRLHDDDGHEWSARASSEAKPRAGVAMRITVTGTVPRTKADSLELEIRAPKTSRKKGDPLPSLRFEH